MGASVGIDVGGTFTDSVMVAGDGTIRVAKAITTANQSFGAVESVVKLDWAFPDISSIVHGTTVATNAILERKGATVGLITTEGFRDVLEFQKQERRNIWDLFAEKSEPLVPRHRRVGVVERVRADGAIRTKLDERSAAECIAKLRDEGCAAIAVCLLNAYANPEHERQLLDLLKREAPDVYAIVSSMIAPHFREYDRMSTTVLSAYVGPKIKAYLSEFRDRFAEKAFKGSILVMGSNGGVIPPEVASSHAAATCLSGPAGGVLATVRVSRQLGIRNAISFDMGGTSTDVSLIRDGAAAMSTRSEISGLPISLPQIHIETVSAGGGSIASIDSGGLLHVGPHSAGSNPGPACYGFGGTKPTVTDAAFLTRLLRPTHFFGGEMSLDGKAAAQAFGPISQVLQTSPEDAAEKVFTIANHRMANAVRVVSVREGHDPRDYALVAFGGAGPLHACAIAEELGMRRVIVPMYPGAFSAYGLLCADLRRDFVQSIVKPLFHFDDAAIEALTSGLVARTEGLVSDLGSKAVRWHFQADCRYRGQAYEVAVDIPPRLPLTQRIAQEFHKRHQRQFGFSEPNAEIELVNLRAIAVVARRKPKLPEIARAEGIPVAGDRDRIFAGGHWVEALFVSRSSLRAGHTAMGPLLIEEATATGYIPRGWTMAVSSQGHIDVTRLQEEAYVR
jgi:N-methylhydantoinase A